MESMRSFAGETNLDLPSLDASFIEVRILCQSLERIAYVVEQCLWTSVSKLTSVSVSVKSIFSPSSHCTRHGQNQSAFPFHLIVNFIPIQIEFESTFDRILCLPQIFRHDHEQALQYYTVYRRN